MHEALVRGPISAVLEATWEARGEVTVVVDLGHKGEYAVVVPPGDDLLVMELGQLIDNEPLSKRKALAELGRRHQMSPNQVYDAIERAKKSAK
jgi:16S rRNA C1402 (ribose-2'-O) methylase RsmI